MVNFLLAVSAVVPSALLVWYFHARDLYPEPARVLWTTFVLGVLTVIPVLIVGVPVHVLIAGIRNQIIKDLVEAFFVAAIPEEFFKLSVLLFYCMRHMEFDEPMDGIVYGVVASLGFATMENLLYVFDGGMAVACTRAFTAVPFHAFAGAVMGYYVGQAKFHPAEMRTLVLKGYLAALLLHGLYDFPLLALTEVEQASSGGILALATLCVLFVEWRWAIRLVRRLRREQDAARIAALLPGQPLAAPGRTTRARIAAIAFAVAGVLFATAGGAVTLGLILAAALGAVAPEHQSIVFVAGLLLGAFPLLGGVVLFVMGVRGMNR